ncbi:MAG: 3-oxoacyl-ACP reductase FabG [Melioribacteraceae bacterium]|nr:3-oxoacyl-ACP reductase FabG [Melioribacteraceae bacterium]
MYNINLDGRTVLITGGSRGIGASCVELFAKAGADIAFTYKNNEEAAAQLVSRYNFEIRIKSYRVNIESADEIERCVRSIKREFGRIDVLINNAGIWKSGKIEEINLEDWNETININLAGVFLFTRFVVPIMKENRSGRIINIASTAGQRGEPYYAHYAASKGGVISMTKSLAVELAPFGIHTNCIAPGWVYTDMTSRELDDEKMGKKIKDYIPLGRAAYPEEIAGPALFLSSSLADHINGEILNVNGGSELCG